MDNRKFDSIARSLASGTSRRSVLKGLFGLGGAALVGTVALDQQADAARRPTPAPKPVTCPGRQTWNGAVCVCPGDATNKCGPDCCTGTTTDPYPRVPGHSECCDNACCFGTCYGEELCCPTNSTGPESPPTHIICDGPNGPICVEGNCCDSSDCDGPCQVCNLRTHTCAGCNSETEVCCTGTTGPGQCVTGECCLGLPGCEEGEICCQLEGGTACVASETCPSICNAENPCDGCATCVEGLCREGCGEGSICCDDECLSASEFFACPVGETVCCAVADACCDVDGCCPGACYGGEGGRDFCCDGVTTIYCEVGEGPAQCCTDVVNEKCCGSVGCCTSSQCNEAADVCCDTGSFACGTSEGNVCCDSLTEKCCDGLCIDASECCAANGDICPVVCDTGSAPDPNGACVACPAGTYGADGLTCSNCAAGYYASEPGNVSCSPCDAGTYQDQTGQTGCVNCDPGTHQDDIGQDVCLACPVGQYANEFGSVSCSACLCLDCNPVFGTCPNGDACTEDSGCESGICSGSVCANCRRLNDACVLTVECCQGECLDNICQYQ